MNNLNKSSTVISSTIGGKRAVSRSSIGRAITASLTVLGMCLICLSTILIIPPLNSEAAVSRTWNIYFYEGGSISSDATALNFAGSAYGQATGITVLRWNLHSGALNSMRLYALRINPSDTAPVQGSTVVRLELRFPYYASAPSVEPVDLTGSTVRVRFSDNTTAPMTIIWNDNPDGTTTLDCYFTAPAGNVYVDYFYFPVRAVLMDRNTWTGSGGLSGFAAAGGHVPSLLSMSFVEGTTVDLGPVIGGLENVSDKVEQIGDQISDKVEELGQTIENVLNPEHDFSGFEDAQAEDAARQAEVKEKINTDAYADEFDDMIDRILDPADELMIPQKLGGVLSLVSESARIITDKMEIKNFLEQLIILGSVGAILGVAVGVPAVIKWGRKKKK